MRFLLKSGKNKKLFPKLLLSIFLSIAVSLNGPLLYAASDMFDTSSNAYRSYNNVPFTSGADVCSPSETGTESKSAGIIPAEGMWVSASIFGGKLSGGKWVQNWADNGGNDLGNHSNHLTYGSIDPVTKLPAGPSFAELGNGKALGGLDNHTKLKITYRGKSIIAGKEDIGAGGGGSNTDTYPASAFSNFNITDPPAPAGKPIVRAVDLWWQTANDLGVTGTAPVFIQAVTDTNQTDNPVTGAPSTDLGGDLPAKTIKQLQALGIDKKLAKTKERYLYAEQETKVPWQVIAALHYREAHMNPSLSIADGSPLSAGISQDGLKIDSDPNKDAALQAKHYLEMAKSVYQIDAAKGNLTMEELGKAFLAYNRGFMYKNWNKSYTESPYVMNGYDDSHLNMTWIDADSYDKPGGRRLNNIAGKRDGNSIGALTIYKYLTTLYGGSTTATDCESSSGRISSNGCSVTSPIFGSKQSGGNGKQLSQQDLTKIFGKPGQGNSEVEKNLVSVDFVGKNARVHKLAAGCLEAVSNEIKSNKINYKIKEFGCYRFDSDNGNTNIGLKSYHTYGVACDINWSTNGFYNSSTIDKSKYDIPQAIIDAFAHHGWSWGGYWNSVKDYMHFEFNGIGPN